MHLTHLTLEWAIEQGFGEYDFLAGEHDYKMRWADGSRPTPFVTHELDAFTCGCDVDVVGGFEPFQEIGCIVDPRAPRVDAHAGNDRVGASAA